MVRASNGQARGAKQVSDDNFMLLGVLRAPINPEDFLAVQQLSARAREAADVIGVLERELNEAKKSPWKPLREAKKQVENPVLVRKIGAIETVQLAWFALKFWRTPFLCIGEDEECGFEYMEIPK
jgi:hypothetical protein